MKQYNVLVLAMSTLSDPLNKHTYPFDNLYYYRKLQTEDETIEKICEPYHGIGQLEPVPQYLLDRYGEITHYVILASEKAKETRNYNWCGVNLEIKNKGIGGEIEVKSGEQLSALTFFEKRIEAFHRDGKFDMPHFEEIDLSDDNPQDGIEKLLEYVRKLFAECRDNNRDENPDDCWRMYVDIHGGLRAMSFIATTLIQILSIPDLDDESDLNLKSGESNTDYISRLTDGRPVIPVTKIYTINFDGANTNKSWIVDQTKLYDVYSKESIKAYMNYGQYAQMALRSTIDPYEDDVKPYAFISYRRADAPKERFTFLGSLKNAGYRYWYDDSIPVRADWRETLEKANKKCTIFIALITKGYYSSYQCLKEMAQAIEEKKPILLFSLDRTPLYSPVQEGASEITLTDEENKNPVTIRQDEINDSISRWNQLDLNDHLRDGIYQLSALIDSLHNCDEFKPLRE